MYRTYSKYIIVITNQHSFLRPWLALYKWSDFIIYPLRINYIQIEHNTIIKFVDLDQFRLMLGPTNSNSTYELSNFINYYRTVGVVLAAIKCVCNSERSYQDLSDAEKNVENWEDQRGLYLYTDHIQLHNSMINWAWLCCAVLQLL